MPDPEQGVDTLRARIEAGERGGAKRHRERLIEFSDGMLLLRETYGWHRHAKLLRHCCRIAEHTDRLAESLSDRDAAEEIVRWIHREYPVDETPETNQNYRVALRIFGKRVEPTGTEPEPPESIAWVTTTLPSDYNPSPDPADMLDWERDIKPALEMCRNPRDAAAIALQFDAGLRGGELYDLTIGSISESKHGLLVRVDGKTGERSVDLIPSTPYVRRWLAEHPSGDVASAPLWSKLTEGDKLSYPMYLRMFSEPLERAGVEKTPTPTNFRKSNLAWLAKRGLNARYIEKRQGRKPGSKAVARYCAIFDEDVGDAYAELMGLEVVDAASDDGVEPPVRCPNCTHETPAHLDNCVHCYQAISPDGAGGQAAQTKRNIESAARDPDLVDALANLEAVADETPGVRVVIETDD